MSAKSCGNCRYFKKIKGVVWGKCTAPAPAWARPKELIDMGGTVGAVWADGGPWDMAERCELYEGRGVMGPTEKHKLFPQGIKMYDEMRSIVWDDDMVALLERYDALEEVAEAAWRLFYRPLENEGMFCETCGTNILHMDALLNALIAAGFEEDE